MEPEKPDREDGRFRQGSIRPLRRGFIIYLMAAVLIAATCYLFGWWTIVGVATAYLYGALFLAIFGLCMVAGNLMPLQLSQAKDVASKNQPVRDIPSDKNEPTSKGVILLATTLIGAALLALTGGLIIIFSGGW